MRIITGFYSLKIKSEFINDTEYILFQRIYHVCYIPIMPKDKIWKTTNGNNTLEQDIKVKLDLIALKSKTPWWAFLGPTLIVITALLGIFGNSIAMLLDSTNSYFTNQNRIENYINKIENPVKNDVYNFMLYVVEPVKAKNGAIKQYKKVDFMNFYVSYQFIKYSEESLLLEALDISGFNHTYVNLNSKILASPAWLKEAQEKYIETSIGTFNKSNLSYKEGMKLFLKLDNITRAPNN